MTTSDALESITTCLTISFTKNPAVFTNGEPGEHGEEREVDLPFPVEDFLPPEALRTLRPILLHSEPPIACRIVGMSMDRYMHKASVSVIPYLMEASSQPSTSSGQTPTVPQLIGIIRKLRTGDCWCECGIDNPMMGGKHTALCLEIQKLIGK